MGSLHWRWTGRSRRLESATFTRGISMRLDPAVFSPCCSAPRPPRPLRTWRLRPPLPPWSKRWPGTWAATLSSRPTSSTTSRSPTSASPSDWGPEMPWAPSSRGIPPAILPASKWYGYTALGLGIEGNLRILEYLSARAAIFTSAYLGSGRDSVLVVGSNARINGGVGVKGSLPVGTTSGSRRPSTSATARSTRSSSRRHWSTPLRAGRFPRQSSWRRRTPSPGSAGSRVPGLRGLSWASR